MLFIFGMLVGCFILGLGMCVGAGVYKAGEMDGKERELSAK